MRAAIAGGAVGTRQHSIDAQDGGAGDGKGKDSPSGQSQDLMPNQVDAHNKNSGQNSGPSGQDQHEQKDAGNKA